MSNKVDWENVKKDYLKSKLTQKELCEKYFITVAQLKYRINKYDWKKSKKKILPKVSNNVIESKEIDYNKEHFKMYEDCAKIIRALTKFYLESDIEPDIGELQKLVAAIEKIQKGQRVSLGLDKENTEVEMPVINIVENLDKNKL